MSGNISNNFSNHITSTGKVKGPLVVPWYLQSFRFLNKPQLCKH